MAALTLTAPRSIPQAVAPVAPFVEGDTVRYAGDTTRTFTVARCYVLTVAGESRWIVEERNADTHPAEELECVGPVRPAPGRKLFYVVVTGIGERIATTWAIVDGQRLVPTGFVSYAEARRVCGELIAVGAALYAVTTTPPSLPANVVPFGGSPVAAAA
jgi:hypothetical protein